MTTEELVKRIQCGEESLIGELWDQIKNFVKKCALDFHADDLTEDLMQESYFGVIAAIKKYDASRGVRFTTFSHFYIRQSMRRFLFKARPGIRLPEHMAVKVRRYDKFVSDFFQKNGREPLDLEAEIMLHMPDINKVKAAAMNPASLDKSIDEDGFSLGDIYAVSDDDAEKVIDNVFHEQLSRELWKKVDDLPEGWGQVIRAKYQENKTYHELAEQFHVSDQVVRSNIEKGMRRLRSDRTLRPFYAELYGRALSGSGLGSFMRTWTSSTERAALWLLGEDYDGKGSIKEPGENVQGLEEE